MHKLINLLLFVWLLCIVDVVEDNFALIEIPQGDDFVLLHVDTEKIGCNIEEGSRILVQYKNEKNFVVKCHSIIDNTSHL